MQKILDKMEIGFKKYMFVNFCLPIAAGLAHSFYLPRKSVLLQVHGASANRFAAQKVIYAEIV
jgi:hypothetical protein